MCVLCCVCGRAAPWTLLPQPIRLAARVGILHSFPPPYRRHAPPPVYRTSRRRTISRVGRAHHRRTRRTRRSSAHIHTQRTTMRREAARRTGTG